MTGPLATVSPLARALRFGRTIRQLRERAGMSQETAAKKAGISRPTMSRVETPTTEPGRRLDPRHLQAALAAVVEPGSAKYVEMEPLIWDATRQGWWDRYRRMGAGQQLVANAECGAYAIREYQTALVPGLAQTEAYARYRAGFAIDDADKTDVVDGRMRRQQQITEPGASRYHAIVEELALRRLAAPPKVMVEQLHHLVSLAELPNVSIRVLPVDAHMEAGYAPLSPFSIYTYPDPDDPTIALVDMVARVPESISDDREVELYAQLFRRLDDAALSDGDSVALFKRAADDLTAHL